MDKLRFLSILLLLVTALAVGVLSCISMYDQAIMTCYVGTSMGLFSYVLSKTVPVNKYSLLMYDIMTSSRLLKFQTPEKALEGCLMKLDKKLEKHYLDDMVVKKQTPEKKSISNRAAAIATGALATYFSMPMAEAMSLRCCQPFHLPYLNVLKSVKVEGIEERLIIENDWYTPGPEDEQIWINGTYRCCYDAYCKTQVVHTIGKLIFPSIFILCTFIAIKVLRYGYMLFSTPVGSKKIKYEVALPTNKVNRLRECDGVLVKDSEAMELSGKCKGADTCEVEVTEYRYFSKLRCLGVLLYLISFIGLMKILLFFLMIAPVDALVFDPRVSTVRINGTLIDPNNFWKELSSAAAPRRVRRDTMLQGLVARSSGTLTEDDVKDLRLSCELDVISYVLAGDFLLACQVANVNKIGYKINDPKIKHIDPRCFELNSIQHARMRTPFCQRACKESKDCSIDYNPSSEGGIDYTIANDNPTRFTHTERMTFSYSSNKTAKPIPVDIVQRPIGIHAGSFLINDLSVYKSEKAFTVFLRNPAKLNHVPQAGLTLFCEPGMKSTASIGEKLFTCTPVAEGEPKLPEWSEAKDTNKYSMPDHVSAGKLIVEPRETTITMNGHVYNIKVEMLDAASFQDNIQPAGVINSYVFSYTAIVTDNTPGVAGIWSSMVADVRHHSYAKKIVRTIPTGRGTNPMDIGIINAAEDIDIEGLGSNVRTVNRFRVTPIENPDNSNCMVTTTGESTIGCSYFVEATVAYTLTGNYLHEIRFLGIPIMRVATSSNVCSDRNSIVISKMCYVYTEHSHSSEVEVKYIQDSDSDISYFTIGEDVAAKNVDVFMMQGILYGNQIYSYTDLAMHSPDYYSELGPCENVHKDTCDGKKAYRSVARVLHPRIRLLERVTLASLDGDMLNLANSDYHRHVVCKTYESKTHCYEEIARNKTYVIAEDHSYSFKVANKRLQIQKGENLCKGCVLADLREMLYRSTYVTVLMLAISGMGYIALVVHLILCLAFFFNPYTLGVMARKIGFSILTRTGKTTRTCTYCRLRCYNELEISKHKNSCRFIMCPYCLAMNSSGDVCKLKFQDHEGFRDHMRLHWWMRINPYVASIKIKRSRALAFVLMPLIMASAIPTVEMTGLSQPTGLRSDRVGSNITVPSEHLRCQGDSCKMISSFRANIPLTAGSSIVLRSVVGDNTYSNKFVIRNPRFSASCDFKYASTSVKKTPNQLKYVCVGKTECNYDTVDKMLFSYMPSHENDQEYVPVNHSDPLSVKYCPKSMDCVSPLVNFMWLTAGCWTVNDGTAIGYTYYYPDTTSIMQSVFTCTVNSIDYDVCDGDNCKAVIGSKSELDDGLVKFQHQSINIPIRFNVAASARLGDSKPSMLFYGAPDVSANTDKTSFAMKVTKLTNRNTCCSGTTYNGGSCRINKSGASPNLVCDSYFPDVSINALSKTLETLSSVYHCNFEKTLIKWSSGVEKRSVVAGKHSFDDSVDYSIPSMELLPSDCNFGYTQVDLVSLGDHALKLVVYKGKILEVKCTGQYNRNNMAMLTFELTGHDGMLEMHCPEMFSQTCLVNTNRDVSCNVTIPYARNGTCEYNGNKVYIDCTNLQMFTPDPTSGGLIGYSGSKSLNTWPASFSMSIGSWWVNLLIIIAIAIVVMVALWLLWIASSCLRVTRNTMSYSGRLTSMEHQDYVLEPEVYHGISSDTTRRRKPMTNSIIIG